MQFLDRLRAKPPHVRTSYALGGAFVSTALIALVWLTTLPPRLAELGGAIQKDVLTEQTASVEDSFDSLLKGIQPLPVPDDVPPSDPEVEQLKINAVGGMGAWNGETTSASTTRAYTNASTSLPDTEATNTPTAARKETVILIGTTTKKTD